MKLCLSVVIVLVLTVCSWGDEPVVQPKTQTVRYDEWGFSVEVPASAVKNTIAPSQDSLLQEAYTSGETVFTIRLSKTPSDSLASTTIEQALQSIWSAGGGKGKATRWEVALAGGALAKGTTGPLPIAKTPARESVIQALRNVPTSTSVAMLPIADDTSPILTISITGPKSKSAEIETLAKFMAFRVELTKRPVGEPTATLPEPGVAPAVPDTKPATPPESGVVHSRRPAVPAQPKPAPIVKPVVLKKGEIELVGKVKSIDAAQNVMTVVVRQIRLPSTGIVKFDTPRLKVVYYKTLPEGLRPESVVTVVGVNTGVGSPMTAAVILASL